MARRLAYANPEIVARRDALALKKTVAGSRLLVGSRYHSLVAALASGVPVLCMGWAHKYAMLLADFDCEELVLDAETSMEAVATRAAELTVPAANNVYRRRIQQRRQLLAESNAVMWRRVHEALVH